MMIRHHEKPGVIYASADDPTQAVSNPTPNKSPDADLFCCAHAFLADGRLVVAGGTTHFPQSNEPDWHMAHWSGSRESYIYDPAQTYPWIRLPLLNRDPYQINPITAQPSQYPVGGGRWYPTLITLPDGRIFTLCGHPIIWSLESPPVNPLDEDLRHNNTKPEVFDPKWATCGFYGLVAKKDMYTSVRCIASIKVFCVTRHTCATMSHKPQNKQDLYPFHSTFRPHTSSIAFKRFLNY